MLGNWSFGDYFKKEAIEYSWELLTKVYGIPGDRLYVTYFEGDEKLGLEPDFEARDLWKSVGVKDDHILPGNAKITFGKWVTKVHVVHVLKFTMTELVVETLLILSIKDDPNVLEIWNNVFIQYNREQDRSLRSLPAKHIDTGMGFERLVSILQTMSI